MISPVFIGGFWSGVRANTGKTLPDENEFTSTVIINPSEESESFSNLFPSKSFQLQAESQSYDTLNKVFIAEGNVKLLINGATLRADRIEFDSEMNSISALGSVRFFRGSSYFQAGSFIYDVSKKTGVLEDVYGVLELDSNLFDLFSEKEKSFIDPHLTKKNAHLSDLSVDLIKERVVDQGYRNDSETIACPPDIPPLPDWQPHPWAVTAWAGQMIDSSFGDTFVFKGRKRPEYLLGIGVQKRIYRSGIFSLELEADFLQHQAYKQSGGKFNQEVPYADLNSQSFGEGIVGIGARTWLQPWLNVSIIEGVSYTTEKSNYENTFRDKASQLLNYLGFEIELSVNKKMSLVGRIHHRSGAFGLFDGVHGGGNGYLVGFRYRWGKDISPQRTDQFPAPNGCDYSFDSSPSDDGNVSLNDSRKKIVLSSKKSFNRRYEEARRTEAISLIHQRITSLELKESLTVEKRFGVPDTLRNLDEKNAYGGILPPQLSRIGNTKFVKGRIAKWRIQASKVFISPEGWKADKMAFTNDPYTPAQARINAVGIIAKEQSDGSTIIQTKNNQLVLEDRLIVPVTRRHKIQKEEEVENRWVVGIDREDRDGFYIGRNLKPFQLNSNNTLYLQPQWNFQRAIDGQTNSYVEPGSSSESSEIKQSTALSDLFGLEAMVNGKIWDWGFDLNADISTFNSINFLNGSRYWGGLNKQISVPLLGDMDSRFFAAYRYRAWNGSLGDTDIYSAFGSFLQKKGSFNSKKLKNNYLWRVGAGNYQAENYRDKNLADLWRGNIYGSLTSSYPIFSGKTAPLNANGAYRYSAKPIIPGFALNSNVNISLSAYGDGRNQSTFGISGGPLLTFGTFSRKFLDYTRLSLTTGVTFKRGSSPFTFDQAIDLGTLGIGLTQQLYGPLILDAGFEYNIDPASVYYGDMINSNIEIRFQRRAYDFALYYNPFRKLGGFRVRLNDFDFNGTGVPFMPTPDLRNSYNHNNDIF